MSKADWLFALGLFLGAVVAPLLLLGWLWIQDRRRWKK
jgi:hypothetical protein